MLTSPPDAVVGQESPQARLVCTVSSQDEENDSTRRIVYLEAELLLLDVPLFHHSSRAPAMRSIGAHLVILM
jgi:hypothetical protein